MDIDASGQVDVMKEAVEIFCLLIFFLLNQEPRLSANNKIGRESVGSLRREKKV